MKVLLSPRADRDGGDLHAVSVARVLAGEDGSVVALPWAGIRILGRPLSGAEVALLREVMREALSGESPEGKGPMVGYVCRGTGLEGTDAALGARGRSRPAYVVAVSDHVNLTWRSPLMGPNDDRVGPRFPSMTGIYLPGVVLERVGATGGIMVRPGVVAGVVDPDRLTAYEAGVVSAQGYPAVSEELAPVAIVAAHMGLRVAAAVVTAGSDEEETVSGRS